MCVLFVTGRSGRRKRLQTNPQIFRGVLAVSRTQLATSLGTHVQFVAMYSLWPLPCVLLVCTTAVRVLFVYCLWPLHNNIYNIYS